MRNNDIRGTKISTATLDAIRRRLPEGWRVGLRSGRHGTGTLVLQAKNGRCGTLRVVSRRRLLPRDAAELVRRAGGGNLPVLVAAPFVSPRSRELLVALSASYADATGNVRIVLDDPAMFIEAGGSDHDPDRLPRALKSLKGSAAGRVVRALCDFAPPYGVRALAALARTPLGTVSRVVSFLETEALLVRGERKRVERVDWAALLARWARDYSMPASNRLSSYLEPRGLPALGPKLASLERYAVTGSLAGPSIAPARLAMIYVDDAAAAAQALELVPAEAGANVWLLEPFDEVVFDRTQPVASGATSEALTLTAVAPSQVVVDLLTSPGRGPQEAAALIERMKGNEPAWRKSPGP